MLQFRRKRKKNELLDHNEKPGKEEREGRAALNGRLSGVRQVTPKLPSELGVLGEFKV